VPHLVVEPLQLSAPRVGRTIDTFTFILQLPEGRINRACTCSIKASGALLELLHQLIAAARIARTGNAV
jgi:hypothetical protein